MLHRAASLLQHYIPQTRIVIRGGTIRNREVLSRGIARKEYRDVMNRGGRIRVVGWQLQFAIICDVQRDVKCIYNM